VGVYLKGVEMLQQRSAGRWALAAKVTSWVAQVAVAVMLGQTLFYKFSYAPETQVIFAERGGRLGATAVGVVELACVILLLIPRTAALGALLSLLVIGGAIFTHLTSLGIAVPEAPGSTETDGGALFGLALLVAAGSLLVLALRWRQLPFVGRALWRGAA
jgi:hypothetical protein